MCRNRKSLVLFKGRMPVKREAAKWSRVCMHCRRRLEEKFSQLNKVLGNIEKFAENQGLQTFFFKEKVA